MLDLMKSKCTDLGALSFGDSMSEQWNKKQRAGDIEGLKKLAGKPRIFQDESWPPEGIQQSIDRVLNVAQIDRYQTGICCRSICYYIESWNHWNFNFRCELADSWSFFSQTFVFRCVNSQPNHPDIRHVGIAEVKAQPLTQWIFGSGCRLFMQKVCQGLNLHQLPLTRRVQRIHMKGDSPVKNKLSHIKVYSKRQHFYGSLVKDFEDASRKWNRLNLCFDFLHLSMDDSGMEAFWNGFCAFCWRLYTTQPLLLQSLLEACSNVQIDLWMTDLPTTEAVHFFQPLKSDLIKNFSNLFQVQDLPP